eukprot:2788817-Rhodomonas_salina.2
MQGDALLNKSALICCHAPNHVYLGDHRQVLVTVKPGCLDMGGVALIIGGEAGDEGWAYQNLVGDGILRPAGPRGQRRWCAVKGGQRPKSHLMIARGAGLGLGVGPPERRDSFDARSAFSAEAGRQWRAHRGSPRCVRAVRDRGEAVAHL